MHRLYFRARQSRIRHAGATVLAALVLAAATPAAGGASDRAARPATAEPAAPFAELRPHFDRNDEAAALEAAQVALTEVGDGSSYVWYRHGGRLSGVVQPQQSFRDTLGRICRQLVVTLSASGTSRHTSAIACRKADGNWVLDG